MTLAETLARNLRAKRGNLTQEQFARKLGVSRATLTRLESSSQNTTLSTLEQIARALRCSAEELLTPDE